MASDRVWFLEWREVLDQIQSFLPPDWRANFTGKVLQRLLAAISVAIEGLYALLAQVLRLSIISTSSGKWLRGLVAGFLMGTYGGVKAQVPVTFKRYITDGPETVIKAGARVSTTNRQEFVTLTDAVLPARATSVTVACEALNPGTEANVEAGAIAIILSNLGGGITEVSNPTAATGGLTAESDAQIRARVPYHLAMLHRATIPATEAAILSDLERFPAVREVKTIRQVAYPGYFQMLVADVVGGDTYRPTRWIEQPGHPGTFFAVLALESVDAVIYHSDFPAKRLGVVVRDQWGREQWQPSPTTIAVTRANYRWNYNPAQRRLTVRLSGQNPEGLVTVRYGLLSQIQTYLESEWVASGVACEVIAPQAELIDLAVQYELEDGYQGARVEQELAQRLRDYTYNLKIGARFALSDAYDYLRTVRGANDPLIISPQGNIEIPYFAIARPRAITITRVG
ncbi:MAG: hypothetical protein DDT26_00815 [Dehalococcoidia bacterium]|nr:hypothetical protein [Chloroflexota bacterium]